MNRSAIKTKRTWFIRMAVVWVGAAGICNAQTINLKAAPAGIAIDGNAKEWGDNLPYANEKAKISYTLSNDKDNLYLVLKTKDTVLQGNILGAGITFSMDINGKKSITFPVNGEGDKREFLYLNPAQVQIKAALARYRKINIEGFAAIADEQLSTSNPYGIQIAMGYNDAGYLVYEEAIPLALLRADDPAGKEWAFYIKINALENEEKAHKICTSYYINHPLDHDLTGYQLALNENIVKRLIAKIIAKGGWLDTTLDDNLDLHGNFSSLKIPDDDKRPDINMVKTIPLAPSVEFEGKFVLAKTP